MNYYNMNTFTFTFVWVHFC